MGRGRGSVVVEAFGDDNDGNARDIEEADTRRADFFRLVMAFACTSAPIDALERVAYALSCGLPLDDRLLADCETLGSALATAYDTAPPRRLAAPAKAHWASLSRLLTGPMTTAQRVRLTRCAGDTATLLSWLMFYAGQPDTACSYTQDARTLSRETGDLTLHAQALGSASILHATTADGGRSGDPRAAVSLLIEANARARHAPPIIRAWLAARLAEEHASASDADEHDRTLDRARAAMDAARLDGATAGFLGVFSGWDTMALDGFEGVGHLLLGRCYEAEAALRHRLAQAGGGMWRATTLTDLAAVLAMQEEPEQSTRALAEAIDLVSHAGNAMGAERIRGVRARFLQRWAPLPWMVDLDEHLMLLERQLPPRVE